MFLQILGRLELVIEHLINNDLLFPATGQHILVLGVFFNTLAWVADGAFVVAVSIKQCVFFSQQTILSIWQ